MTLSKQTVVAIFSYRHPILWLSLVAMFCFLGPSRFIHGQEPLQIDAVNVYGLSSNASTVVEIHGKGFDESLRLLLPFASQQKLTLISALHAQLEIGLGPIPPQTFWGAFRTRTQLAGLRRWTVDNLPNVPFSSNVSGLPLAMNGTLSGNQIQRTTVGLNEGEYLYVDIQAKRLGANFQPLLRVLDERNRQVASSVSQLALDGDSACSFRVPRTGKYTIAVQDLTFSAPAGPFRLRLARTTDANLAMAKSFESIPAKSPIDEALFSRWALPDYRSSAPIDFSLQGAISTSVSQLSRTVQTTWTRYSTSSLTAEELPNVGKVLRVPNLPAVINGSIQDKEAIRFIVSCGANKPLDADVWATRLGADIDSKISILALDRRTLALGDDRPGTIDPRTRFGGDPNISDVLVVIEPVIPILGQKEGFELVLSQTSVEPIGLQLLNPQLIVAQNSHGLLDLTITRNGMNQPIEFSAVVLGEPQGHAIAQSAVIVPENQEKALVPVHLGENLDHQPWIVVLAKYPNSELFRVEQAVVAGRSIMAAGTAEHSIPVIQTPTPLNANVAWKEGTPETFEFVAGRAYDLPIQWTWNTLTDEQKTWLLKTELVTTQHVPRTNPQDGNSPIDYRKAVQVGTIEPDGKTIKIVPNGDPKAPGAAAFGQTAVNGEGILRLVVPADAAEDRFQWSLKWSALDAAGKVQGTPWLLKPLVGRIVPPLTLKLEKELSVPWNWSKDDTQNSFNVTITPQPGVAGTVQLTWQGLPQGIHPPVIDVELTAEPKVAAVKLPDLSQQAAGTKLEGLKLVLQWKPNPDGSNGTFTSPPLSLPALNFP